MNLDSFPIEYLLVAMAGIILYLIYYVFTKDSEYNKNIHSVASVVEDLNRELYYLKKKLQDTQNGLKNSSSHMSDEEIYQEIERSVYDMVQPLSIGLKKMQDTMQTLDVQIDSRITSLETGVKQISIPSSIHGNDD